MNTGEGYVGYRLSLTDNRHSTSPPIAVEIIKVCTAFQGRVTSLLTTRPTDVGIITDIFAASHADMALQLAVITRHILRMECRKYGAIHSSA